LTVLDKCNINIYILSGINLHFSTGNR